MWLEVGVSTGGDVATNLFDGAALEILAPR
jgi:hypothetical protein